MGKNGGSSTVMTPEIPAELSPLLMQTVDTWMQFQRAALGNMMGTDYVPGAGVQPWVDTENGEGVWGRYFRNLGIGGGKKSGSTSSASGTMQLGGYAAARPTDGTIPASAFMAALPGGGGFPPPPGGGHSTGGEDDAPFWAPLPEGWGARDPAYPLETGAGDVSFGGSGGWVPNVGWQEPESIFGNAARPVVGPSGLENWAAGLVPQLTQKPGEYSQAEQALRGMGDVSRRRVTGEGLQDDPAYAAAINAYSRAMQPMVENQAALAGLGRSTALTNANASAQAQYLMPTIQDYFGREERSIDRELGALGQQYQGYTGLGDRSTDRLRTAIGTGMEVGGIGRGISQDWADSQYNDWLRRAALFEQAIGGPLGMVPSTIGSTATSQTSKK